MLKKKISGFLIFSLFIFLFYSSNVVFSNNYYADLNIDVLNDGRVSIDGTTNYLDLQNISNSENFTSKNKAYWLFNLTTNQVFDDFIFKLNLPENVQVNYIKTTPNFRVKDNGNSLTIIGLGKQQPLNILVQYKITNQGVAFFTHEQLIFLLSLLLLLALITIGIIVIIDFRKSKKLENKKKKEEKEEGKKERELEKEIKKEKNNEDNTNNRNDNENENKNKNINLDFLSERQKQIVEIINSKKEISQKELQKIMQIPKSSISRNVNSLVSKNIVKKSKKGITTYLSIEKE